MKLFLNQEWQAANALRFDLTNMFVDAIGTAGIKEQEVETNKKAALEAEDSLKQKRPQLAWRDLPYGQTAVVSEIVAFADKARHKFTNFVVLGIGGSALGPLAVQQALNHLYYNELPKNLRDGRPRLYVIDNADPERFAALLDLMDPAETLFNVITKSGSTSETMSQFMLVRALLKERLGDKYYEHLVATTDSKGGSLVKIARQEGYRLFYIPEGVGGRFSELCPVGLLPAAMTGIDIEELLAGAAFMDQWIESKPLAQNPAYLLALLQILAYRKGNNISVLMPYADSLKYIADWYAQLWAESLGKRNDLTGKEVCVGQTPVKALGVTDQHSQVQLYTEGPFDKVITFLRVEEFRREVKIPTDFVELTNLAFLGGHSLNELMDAEQRATAYALTKAGRLNNTIILPRVNPFTVGQLLYLFEVETAFAGELLQVDAFNQPGVEEGKNATYALLGRPGFEQKKVELTSGAQKSARYVLSV
ncbi:MAG TPA: glucose-6-phosphate isomerase [Desulfobacteria bacterium]|nr:glucose-6-phosphate isomerase [Desulfobacteria bacterium]